MLDKFNQLCDQILNEAKEAKAIVPKKRKVVRIKNMPTKNNVDQFCKGKTKPMRTPLTQTANVK